MKGRIGGTNNLADSCRWALRKKREIHKSRKKKKLLRFLKKKKKRFNRTLPSKVLLSPLSEIIVIPKLWGTSDIFFVVHLFFLSLFLIVVVVLSVVRLRGSRTSYLGST